MRILRFAVATFRTDSSIKPTGLRVGDVDVDIRSTTGVDTDKNTQSFLLTASVALDEIPEKDAANRIIVPAEQRERCEFAIDAACDLLATFYGCSRSIRSPSPCIALEHEGAEERDYLERSRGILATHTGESGVRNEIPVQGDLLGAVSDRLEGVALLAEAYSGSESGRYREFVRLFERAFAGPFTQLSKVLEGFFRGTVYGYTRSEIENWVARRHSLSHADLRRTPNIGLTSDVRRLVMRMEQAALDVLFNKASWGDRSKARRIVWVPTACATSEKGHIVVKQNTKLSIVFRICDEFDVYPKALNIGLSQTKESWYFMMNQDTALRSSADHPKRALKDEAGRDRLG